MIRFLSNIEVHLERLKSFVKKYQTTAGTLDSEHGSRLNEMINAIIYKQPVDTKRFPIGYRYPKIITDLIPYTKKEDKTLITKAKLR